MTSASGQGVMPAMSGGTGPGDDAGTSGAGAAPPAPDPVGAAETRVAAVLADLDAVGGWPPADQLAAFATTQQALQATLASIDDFPAGSPSPAGR